MMPTDDRTSSSQGVTSGDRDSLVEWMAIAFPGRLGLSMDEFAVAFGYSRGHVKNLVAARRVRIQRTGRRVIIPMDAAIEFMIATNGAFP